MNGVKVQSYIIKGFSCLSSLVQKLYNIRSRNCWKDMLVYITSASDLIIVILITIDCGFQFLAINCCMICMVISGGHKNFMKSFSCWLHEIYTYVNLKLILINIVAFHTINHKKLSYMQYFYYSQSKVLWEFKGITGLLRAIVMDIGQYDPESIDSRDMIFCILITWMLMM